MTFARLAMSYIMSQMLGKVQFQYDLPPHGNGHNCLEIRLTIPAVLRFQIKQI